MEELAQKIQEIDINQPETPTGTKGSHSHRGNRNTKSITRQITHDYTKLPKDQQSLNVLYANVKSIKKKGKIDELKCILKMIPKTVHLILLTESWIKTDDSHESIELENYNLVSNSRNDRRGGGVAAYIRMNIQYSIEGVYKNGNNYLWVHLEELKLHFGVVYYPPNTDEEAFLVDFESQLQKWKDNRAIIVGDFNTNVLDSDESGDYENILKDAGFEILNSKTPEYYTRKNIRNNTVTKVSIIDHVWSNLPGEYHLALIDSSLSDHRQLYFEIRNAGLSPKDREENGLTSPNSYWSRLSKAENKDSPVEDAINQIINKVNSKNLRHSDWITEKVCKGITARNRFHQEYQKKPNEKTKRLFDKANVRKNEIIESKKSEHEILTLIKSEINKKNPPSELRVGSKTYTDSKEICEQFDIYFSNITGFENNPPDQPHIHSGVDTRNKQNNKTYLYKMEPCTSEEISKIIASLDPNASAGIDGTNVESIKGTNICNKLSDYFNSCFDSGVFPDCLKISKVIPVYKSGGKSKLQSYTFQWVPSVFSRILEKLLWKRITKEFDTVEFYVTENQYGYREKPNTVIPTINLASKMITSMDNKQIVLGLFIDLKEALKKVNHSLLLKKIEGFGINGLALQIIESYFINRKYVVSTGTSETNPRDIKQGVPQGSVLGHLLFLMYINDVRTLNLNGNITVSAEKISLFYYGVEIKDLFERAQQDLNSLSDLDLFKDNGSGVNPNEISYVIFTRKQIYETYRLYLSGIEISQAADSLMEYFGLILDSKLTWKAHVSKIKKILQMYHENVKSVARCPQSHGLLFYNTYVRPYTDYLIELWGKSSVGTEKLLQDPLTTLKRKLNVVETEHILNLQQNISYKTCILVYKIIHQGITELTFKTNDEVTNRELRSKNLLWLPKMRTMYGEMSFSYAGAKIYNGLPEIVRNADNIKIFKQQLRSHLGIEKKRELRQQKQDDIDVNTSTGGSPSDATNTAYQCKVCKETDQLFNSPHQRKKHRDTKHPGLKKNKQVFRRIHDDIDVNTSTGGSPSDATSTAYQCKVCKETDQLFNSPHQRKKHRDTKHPGLKKNKQVFRRIHDDIDVNTSTGGSPSNATNTAYQCKVCKETDQLFNSPHQRKKHKDTKHPGLKKNKQVFRRIHL